MANFVTKSEVEKPTGDTYDWSEKVDSACQKFKVDKLDVDNLERFPTDLSKLRNVLDNEVVKNSVYDYWVAKVNTIEILIIKSLLNY